MSISTLYFENGLASISTYATDYAQLTYHPGKHTLEDFWEALQHAGELLQHRRWHRLLEDQRQLAPLTTEQQLVMTRYWQRQTRYLSYPLCVAAVLPRNVFARLAMAALRYSLQTTAIDYRLFTDAAKANSWLQAQASCARLDS